MKCVAYHSTAASPGKGNRPKGIRKASSAPVRKSERLQRLTQQLATEKLQDSVPSVKGEPLVDHPEIGPARDITRKRKLCETQIPSHRELEQARKRQRAAPDEVALRETANRCDPIDYWRKHSCRWPKELFCPEPIMKHMLARKKSSSSVRRRAAGTETGTTENTQSDPVQYQDPLYKQNLAEKGVYMDDYDVVEGNEELFSSLFAMEQPVPEHSRFSDKLFKYTLRNIQDKNETRVKRDISLLIVPSPEDLAAEHLATDSGVDLTCLIESTNEPWNASIKIVGPKPQPDHAVGFRRDAFNNEQLQRLQPFIGERKEESFFRATYLMYFPFLTSEVKCGAAALDIADCQNAHSMAIGVRAVVELFRIVGREQELHRTILGFSISHDHRTVRIYGYYACTKGKTTYHRQQVDTFDFTALNGKRRWKTYKFIKSVYEQWMPEHLRRICSAIDQIPLGVNFAMSQPSDSQPSEGTGLAQQTASDEMVESVESTESEKGLSGTAVVTPSTSVSHEGSRPREKRKHKCSISDVEQ